MLERLEIGGLKLLSPFLGRVFHQKEAAQLLEVPIQEELAPEVAGLQDSGDALKGLLNPTETFNYLMSQVVERRQPIEPTVFKKDQDMYRRVGQYEKALTAFLGQPDILEIGDEIQKHQLWLEVLAQSHQNGIEAIEEKRASLTQQRSAVLQQQSQLEARIAGINEDKVLPGDQELMFGRVQVQLWNLQRRNRPLTWLAKRFIGIWGSREVHPKIAPYHQKFAQLNSESIRLQNNEQQASSEYSTQKADQEKYLETEQGSLWEQMDRWVLQDFDRFLVHLTFYPDRRFRLIQQYRTAQHLDREDWQNFLDQLKSHNLLPPEVSSYLPTPKPTSVERPPSIPQKEAAVRDTTLLPMAVIIDGQILTDRNLARREFNKLTDSLSHKRQRQIFNKFVMALTYEAQGAHHPDSTVLKADDMVERLRGAWRLRVGRYRLVGNLFSLENDQRVLEVVEVIQRDHPNYY